MGRRGDLSPLQLERLDGVGDWRTAAREKSDTQRWRTRLSGLKDFLATGSAWPRYVAAL